MWDYKDYISRQAAIDGKILIQRANGVEIYTDEAVPVEYLKNVPAADVVPMVHAYWEGEETDCNIKCHKCGKAFKDYIITQDYIDLSEYPNFCPNCGAKMDGGES